MHSLTVLKCFKLILANKNNKILSFICISYKLIYINILYFNILIWILHANNLMQGWGCKCDLYKTYKNKITEKLVDEVNIYWGFV